MLLTEQLFDPLTYPFMVRGPGVAVIVGIVSALVGTYVILRGWLSLGMHWRMPSCLG